MDIQSIYDDYIAPHFDADYFDLNKENRKIALGQIQGSGKPAFHNILDLGMGTGEFLKALSEYFPQASLVGMDASEKMIEIAREKFNQKKGNPLRLIQEDIHHIEKHLSPQTFDLVILHFLLNYVDHEKVISQVYSTLKKGGSFSVSNCSADSFPVLHSLATNFVSEEFLQTKFNVPQDLPHFKEMLKQHGFTVRDETNFHKEIVFPTVDFLYNFVLHSGWLSNPFFLQMTDEQVKTYREFIEPLFPLKEEFKAMILLAEKP